MNKKGILFSIISLMISILIITIYSVSFDTDLETEVAQVNSRAELIDTTFNIIETNIETIVSATSYTALNNMALSTHYLYDDINHEAYDLDPQCSFKNLMFGGNIRLFYENEFPTYDIIFDVPGAFDTNVCSNTPVPLPFNNNFAYVQRIIPTDQVYTTSIRLGTQGPANDDIVISILDSCRREISRYEGSIKTPSGTSCTDTSIYDLDRPVEFKPGETYYIYVTGKPTSFLRFTNNEEYIDYSGFIYQNISDENITEDNYGYNPKLERSVVDFLDDVNVFLYDNYKIESNYTLKDIGLRQETPWEVIVEGRVIVSTSDPFFKVNKNLPFKVNVDIRGLPDPMFSKFRESRTIVKERPVTESKLNYTYLTTLIYNGTYVKDTASPKYLDRFTSNINSSRCCGLETFFDPRNPIVLNEHDASVLNTISAWMLLNEVDLCSGSESELFLYQHTGSPSFWFLLDDHNRGKFNMTDANQANFPYAFNQEIHC